MTIEEALALARDEFDRARSLHHNFNSGHEGYAVLREEVDELWDAVKRQKSYVAYNGAVAREAVQVAAMALRFLVDLVEANGVGHKS